MNDDPIAAHRRLTDALAAEILAAEAAEVLSSHPGHEARVVADALRQALRRSLAAARDPRAAPPHPPQGPARPQPRQEKKP
jgi:hypothetical protein